MKCPKCGQEMVENMYHIAVDLRCDFFCSKCGLHYNSKTKQFITDEDIEDVNPYTSDDLSKLRKKFRK